MLKKVLQSPIVITTASLVYLAWAIADYYEGSQHFENRLAILALVPLVVYSLWIGWVLFLLKNNYPHSTKIFERRIYAVFIILCILLFVFQFQVSSPAREILRYTMFCLIGGVTFAAGLIKYFENKNMGT